MTWMTLDRPLPAYAWLMARVGPAGPLVVPTPPRCDGDGEVLRPARPRRFWFRRS